MKYWLLFGQVVNNGKAAKYFNKKF